MENTIANTILQQLGGSKFVAMTGARLLALENGLAVRIGRNSRRINHVQVELRGDDTYTVRFGRIARRGLDYAEVATFDGVYAEQLRELFENNTGMRTTL